jgi:hypothetical protein
MLHQGIKSSYYRFESANAAFLPSLSKSALMFIAIHKIISQDVVVEVKQTETWQLGKLTRALTIFGIRMCPPRHRGHCRCVKHHSSPLLPSLT